MNHMPLGGLTAAAPHRPNQRAQAKLRTREKIETAARALFAERGYEGATIREIAKAAGMSTGAVFASFTDKSDLFTEIAESEQAELVEAMRAAAKGLAGEAAILAMLDAAAARQAAGPALFHAVMGALWTPGLAEQLRRRLDRRPVSSLIAVAVGQALEADTGAAADVGLISEMIWDGYLAAVRRARLGGMAPGAVGARIAAMVRIILAGGQAI